MRNSLQQLAGEYGVSFMETSAKANINVEEAFMKIARAIKRKIDEKVVSTPTGGDSGNPGGLIRPSDPTGGEKKGGFFSMCSLL